MDRIKLNYEGLITVPINEFLEKLPQLLQHYDNQIKVTELVLNRIEINTDSEEERKKILRVYSFHCTPNNLITLKFISKLKSIQNPLLIISIIGKICDGNKEEVDHIIEEYSNLIEENRELVIPIIGSLSELTLTNRQKKKVFELTTSQVKNVDDNDVPVIIRTLMSTMTQQNAQKVIQVIRRDTAGVDSDTYPLLLEVINNFLRISTIHAKNFLESIQGTSQFQILDLFILVTLLTRVTHRSRVIEVILTSLNIGTMNLEILKTAFFTATKLNMLIPNLIVFCQVLLTSETIFVMWAHDLYIILFEKCPDCRKSIVSSLIIACSINNTNYSNRINSIRYNNNNKAILEEIPQPQSKIASKVLYYLVTRFPKQMSKFEHLLQELLYQCYRKPIFMTHRICNIWCQLSKYDDGLQNTLLIFIQKQLWHNLNKNAQCSGVIAASHLLDSQALEYDDQNHLLDWILLVNDKKNILQEIGNQHMFAHILDLLTFNLSKLENSRICNIFFFELFPILKKLGLFKLNNTNKNRNNKEEIEFINQTTIKLRFNLDRFTNKNFNQIKSVFIIPILINTFLSVFQKILKILKPNEIIDNFRNFKKRKEENEYFKTFFNKGNDHNNSSLGDENNNPFDDLPDIPSNNITENDFMIEEEVIILDEIKDTQKTQKNNKEKTINTNNNTNNTNHNHNNNNNNTNNNFPFIISFILPTDGKIRINGKFELAYPGKTPFVELSDKSRQKNLWSLIIVHHLSISLIKTFGEIIKQNPILFQMNNSILLNLIKLSHESKIHCKNCIKNYFRNSTYNSTYEYKSNLEDSILSIHPKILSNLLYQTYDHLIRKPEKYSKLYLKLIKSLTKCWRFHFSLKTEKSTTNQIKLQRLDSKINYFISTEHSIGIDFHQENNKRNTNNINKTDNSNNKNKININNSQVKTPPQTNNHFLIQEIINFFGSRSFLNWLFNSTQYLNFQIYVSQDSNNDQSINNNLEKILTFKYWLIGDIFQRISTIPNLLKQLVDSIGLMNTISLNESNITLLKGLHSLKKENKQSEPIILLKKIFYDNYAKLKNCHSPFNINADNQKNENNNLKRNFNDFFSKENNGMGNEKNNQNKQLNQNKSVFSSFYTFFELQLHSTLDPETIVQILNILFPIFKYHKQRNEFAALIFKIQMKNLRLPTAPTFKTPFLPNYPISSVYSLEWIRFIFKLKYSKNHHYYIYWILIAIFGLFDKEISNKVIIEFLKLLITAVGYVTKGSMIVKGNSEEGNNNVTIFNEETIPKYYHFITEIIIHHLSVFNFKNGVFEMEYLNKRLDTFKQLLNSMNTFITITRYILRDDLVESRTRNLEILNNFLKTLINFLKITEKKILQWVTFLTKKHKDNTEKNYVILSENESTISQIPFLTHVLTLSNTMNISFRELCSNIENDYINQFPKNQQTKYKRMLKQSFQAITHLDNIIADQCSTRNIDIETNQFQVNQNNSQFKESKRYYNSKKIKRRRTNNSKKF
ncbi:fanconi anemia group d2 protein [Anaeramoeba flamelloides]|uniref:Fanconi anemia group d2 protein n=1 Tax=Anaeramoeba flamelloides TaxID=1746091 RepID=A0AAV7ZTY3_9EUKA|nr:fanconi anemia group d2 protein [Anaeramoeba flamelloides]